MFDFFAVRVGVAAPEETVEALSSLTSVVAGTDGNCVDAGGSSFNVEDSLRSSSPTVLDGCNCLSSRRILALVGRVVDADKKSRTCATVCDGLTFSLIAVENDVSVYWTACVIWGDSLLSELMLTSI